MHKDSLQTVLGRITSTPFPAPGGGYFFWSGQLQKGRLRFWHGEKGTPSYLSLTFEELKPDLGDAVAYNWGTGGKVTNQVKQKFYSAKITTQVGSFTKEHFTMLGDPVSRALVVAGFDPIIASLAEELMVRVDGILREIE